MPRLIVVESPYRDIVRPVLDQIENLKTDYPGRTIAIVVPEIIEKHW